MPNGRFMSRSVAHDVELNSVSMAADLLFERCVPHLDVEGRMLGHPVQVKAIAVPIRAEFTVDMVGQCLEELARAGLVKWYEIGGRRFLEFPGFAKNQPGLRKDREASSSIPPAPSRPSRPSRARPRRPLSQNGSHSGVNPEHSGGSLEDSGGSLEDSGGSLEDSGVTPLAHAAARVGPYDRAEVEVEVRPTPTASPTPSLRSGEPPEGARPARRRKHTLPPSWSPTARHAVLATELHVDARREAEKFRDHAEATGRLMADWDAAFRTWLRNAPQYANGHGRAPPAQRVQSSTRSLRDVE